MVPKLSQVISLVTVLSIMNATLMVTPRILVGLSRDGLCTPKAAAVSASGTPRFALGLSGAAAALLILTGTFEQIMALGAVAFVFNYISAYTAVFLLRRREPTLQRPYRAVGFPLSTAVVLLGSVLFLAAAVAGDHRSAVIAAALLIASAPRLSLPCAAPPSRASRPMTSRGRRSPPSRDGPADAPLGADISGV